MASRRYSSMAAWRSPRAASARARPSREGKVPDWIEAFTYGQAKASGPEQFLKLIVNVVERQQERQRMRKARRGP